MTTSADAEEQIRADLLTVRATNPGEAVADEFNVEALG